MEDVEMAQDEVFELQPMPPPRVAKEAGYMTVDTFAR
jgi:hypothetical protein